MSVKGLIHFLEPSGAVWSTLTAVVVSGLAVDTAEGTLSKGTSFGHGECYG